ncbi:MAG: TonB-dependent receptor, partial [Bryobacteraceae bacterium]
ETETHTMVIVNANRTTTVDGDLKVGTVATTVEVTATPLMNQVDTTNGYVVDQLTIQETPLGTGSFTQLAIMSPGVHADFLGGAGSNSGLGNQAIFANGNRDTSNSFSLNGVDTNNLFNGNSTSQVGENRFVLNIGENFGAGGAIQTSTSVYGAIGQALPTPPVETIQEVAVNTAMYDATQGAHSGAHISVITKSGTNELHGMLYEDFQNSVMNAAPFFYNSSPAIINKDPFLARNQFGVNLGGPIKQNKLFYFVAYQGVRLADAADATKDVDVPVGLTNDRSAQGIVNAMQSSYGTNITTSQISPVALAMLQAKLPGGQYLFPSAQITNPNSTFTYDAVVEGPNAQSSVNQGIANVDYNVNDMDRLTVKYYYQTDPTTNPFGAVGALLGFPQQLSSGSQVGAINNTVILSPSLTWQQHAGFTRLQAYSQTQQQFTPSDFGMNLLGATDFPQIEIAGAYNGSGLEFGPSVSFGNAGMYQNQWELGSSLNWVKGRHTIAVGGSWAHTQLNIINNNTESDTLGFKSFVNFVEGAVRTGSDSAAFPNANASRYYRSDTAGAYVNDNYKVASNLSLTLGLRWDFDGPLSEKYGRLATFNPSLYSYNADTDTITNSGLDVASNNSAFGTPGAGNSLMNTHQWGFAPRVGLAWTPKPKLTVRTGFGMYYDRGELFSEFSPSAGFGFNGPLGVTLEQPFVTAIFASKGATLATPFGTTAPPPPPQSPAAFQALLPNLNDTLNGNYPAGNLFGPFLIGGYDANNKLPYTVNWTFDIQYQLSNSWLFSAGYVGNHGVHEVLPIPFNQPGIATAQHPINGQTASYGGITPYNLYLDNEPYDPAPEYAGNAPGRVPYIGYDMNSVLYEAEGISNYNALTLQARKRLSNGLQFTASYTWSHALDEQSGLGLFFTGNNPLDPKSNYASADFDQTHVFLINYSYTLPKVTSSRALGYLVNGWTIGGQTVAQSGQPYSVYDFSGAVASLYYGASDYITNPIVPLLPGVTAKQAELQGTTGVNANNPVLNVADFGPQFVTPGTNGVPACDSSGCDSYESLYSNTGRNLFRAPFQVRFDMSLAKEFQFGERYRLRFNFDAFNLFNHPDFDAPNNNVSFFGFNYAGPPLSPSNPDTGDLGYITHTIGSPRFLQLSLHLSF